jgi:hypothetical protein
MKLLTHNKHHIQNHIQRFITVFICVISFYINTNKSLAAGGDTEQPTQDAVIPPTTDTTTQTTPETPVNSTNSATPNAITVTPTTLLQTGNNNYANVNSNLGALNYPNCGGTCAFAIMRTTSNNNNFNGTTNNQIEGVFGVIHSFSSPDQTNAQSNRQLVNIQQQRSESDIVSNYINTIADACKSKDMVRAELTAKALARIWKEDYQSLLNRNCR